MWLGDVLVSHVVGWCDDLVRMMCWCCKCGDVYLSWTTGVVGRPTLVFVDMVNVDDGIFDTTTPPPSRRSRR